MLSMTGYGRAGIENSSYRISVEIKTVNHRYCDFAIKLPKKLLALEDKVRSFVQEKISRGRVEIYVKCEEISKLSYTVTPDFAVLDQYNNAFNDIVQRYELRDRPNLSLFFRCQDAFDIKYDPADEDAVWVLLEQALEQALYSVLDMRKTEGDHLKLDIINYLEEIKSNLEEVIKYAPEISKKYQEKMLDRIESLLDESMEVDHDKIAHEIAIFADKTAIDEEIVRLNAHINQFEETMLSKEPIGRKLDFIIQEMNREVNTIGSKSPDFDISEKVIDMKSIIEKIREQIQNLE